MSAKRKSDDPEEVYVLKTEISSVETKTKSVRLEIPDFMERINEMEDDGEELLSIGKLNVDGYDFGIRVLRVWPYESIIRVYVKNMNDFDATVSIKLAGMEGSFELEVRNKLDFSLENCMTWAEKNGDVLNLDVKITQKPGQKTVWKR